MRARVIFLANSETRDAVVTVSNAPRFVEGHFSQPLRSVVFRDKAGQLMNVAVPDDWKSKVTKEGIANAQHAHFFQYCKDKIAPTAEVDDPDAFCAWLKDRVEGTDWRHGAANEHVEFVGNAVEFSHGADGWVQLTPYGRFAHEMGDQLFTREDAEQMVNQFNAAANAPQRALGVPWYIGHPDHPRFKEEYTDKRAYGRVKKMEARADGLWANVRWSTDGKKLIEDQAYHGHSVNWGVVKRGEFWRPVALKSVGFTNEPNIPVLPVTAANEKGTTVNKEKLCKALGLDPATATEAEIEAKLANELANARDWKNKFEEADKKLKEVGNISNEKKAVEDKLTAATTELTNERTGRKTDVDAEKAKVVAKETEFANERKAHVKSVLDMAVIGGCITLADRPKWEQEFANDHGGALTKVLALKPTLHMHSGVSRKDQRLGAPADKRALFMANVTKRMKNDGLDYNAAFNAERQEHPELLATAAA